jgi:predicted small metal-binding protein
MREFRCAVIVPGCDAVLRAASDEEIVAVAAEHSRALHGIDEVPPEIVDRIRAATTEADG